MLIVIRQFPFLDRISSISDRIISFVDPRYVPAIWSTWYALIGLRCLELCVLQAPSYGLS